MMGTLRGAAKGALAELREPGQKILLFNVKYSANLGDGLIAECLEREIRAQMPQAEVESVDLAGRVEYRPGTAARLAVLTTMNASPLVARQAFVKLVLGARLRGALVPSWRRRLRGVDAVVLGGGNLLSDSDLNFPLKIDAALGAAREAGAPIGVFAVGVSDNWSAEGARLFSQAFGGAPLFFSSVRDFKSADVWRRRLSPLGVKPATVVCDPGLLASAHFPAAPRRETASPVVGLGIMHPTLARYHSNERPVPTRSQREWLIQFASACLAQGWTLRLFTNGSPEDEAYLKAIAADLRACPGAERIRTEPRFSTPAQLAQFVSGLDLMFAHRLHANIAAYSYGVPQIGFSWDSKLASFLDQVGRGDCLVTAGVDSVEATVGLGVRELRVGIDRAVQARTLYRAREDIGQLLSAIRQTIVALNPAKVLSARQAAPA